MNRRRRKIIDWLPWFKNQSLALNGVAPSLIHDYGKNRYYNTAVGSSGFPFTATRTTNATMFNNAGQLVWAPANQLPQTSMIGATAGVLGSGGALPTQWAASSATGITREVVAVGVDYIDYRLFGTNSSGSLAYPHLKFATAGLPLVNGQSYTISATLQVIAGDYTGFTTSAGKLTCQWLNGVAYVSEMLNGPAATTTLQRISMSGLAPASGVNLQMPQLNIAIAIDGVVDITFRVSMPQLENTGVDSPKPYIQTTGTAMYCARRDYDPVALLPRGVLVEGAATNLITTSTAVTTTTGGTAALSPATYLGNQAAYRVTLDTLVSGHFSANGSLTVAAATVYTISTFYVPISGGNGLIQLVTTGGAADVNVYANFDTTAKTVVGSGAGASNIQIIDCGGGVLRLSLSFTSIAVPAGGSVVILAKINSAADTRIPSTTGAGEVFDFFGSQCETGAFASSLIPTTGIAATRGIDNLTTATGSWLDAAKGTIYADFMQKYVAPGAGSSTTFAQIYTDSGNRVVLLCGSGTNSQHRFDVFDATVAQTQKQTSIGGAQLTARKMAGMYIANLFRAAENGAASGDDTLGTIPAMTTLSIGCSGTSNQMNGWVKEFRYYPVGDATDAQLATLTN